MIMVVLKILWRNKDMSNEKQPFLKQAFQAVTCYAYGMSGMMPDVGITTAGNAYDVAKRLGKLVTNQCKIWTGRV